MPGASLAASRADPVLTHTEFIWGLGSFYSVAIGVTLGSTIFIVSTDLACAIDSQGRRNIKEARRAEYPAHGNCQPYPGGQRH